MFVKISITALFAILFVSVSAADDLLPFSATCKDKQVEAYRYATDVNGKIINDEWSKGEKFQSKWHFKYTGGDVILLDGKPFPIIAKSGPCIIFSDGGEAPFGVGIWVYAINLKLKRIVAAQVQAGHGIIVGIKTRSVCLDCDFDN